jgi:hypothetical protein
MAAESGANVHDSAPPPAAALRRGGRRPRRLVGVRRGGRALGIEVRVLSREDLAALIEGSTRRIPTTEHRTLHQEEGDFVQCVDAEA